MIAKGSVSCLRIRKYFEERKEFSFFNILTVFRLIKYFIKKHTGLMIFSIWTFGSEESNLVCGFLTSGFSCLCINVNC